MSDIAITMPRESAEQLLAALKFAEGMLGGYMSLELRMAIVGIRQAKVLIANALLLGEVPESLT